MYEFPSASLNYDLLLNASTLHKLQSKNVALVVTIKVHGTLEIN